MARPASVFARIDSEQQRDELTRLWKEDSHHFTRLRAHAILLSSQGFEVNTLAGIFDVTTNTVRAWLRRFEADGVDALHDADRPGGPPLLNDEDQELLRELFRKFPNRPSKILVELEQKTGKTVSDSSLRNYARRLGLTWKRFRRSMRQRRDQRAFDAAREELAEFLKEPNLDLVYFDEAGFSLRGVVPYGWQPVGERTDVPVGNGPGPTFQVLGFEHQHGTVDSYVHKGYVNSDTVIEVFDRYSLQIQMTTVVVLDNASCHTSEAFMDAAEEWMSRGLYIYYLPPYSPELNTIERYWKKVKYQLVPATAWERFQTLLESVSEVLHRFGEVVYTPALYDYCK